MLSGDERRRGADEPGDDGAKGTESPLFFAFLGGFAGPLHLLLPLRRHSSLRGYCEHVAVAGSLVSLSVRHSWNLGMAAGLEIWAM